MIKTESAIFELQQGLAMSVLSLVEMHFHTYIKPKSRLGLDDLDVFQTTTCTIREPAADAFFLTFYLSSSLTRPMPDMMNLVNLIGLHTTSTTKRAATTTNIATHGQEKTPPARIASTIAHFQCRFS